MIITSGLAEGIDSYAHQGALSANKPTIAVLAHGLDQEVVGLDQEGKELGPHDLRDVSGMADG